MIEQTTECRSTDNVSDTHPSSNANGRRRRARTMFDEDAIRKLEGVFRKDQYPDITQREILADDLRVPEARIQTWFQNKRSRTKRTFKGGCESSGTIQPASLRQAPRVETCRKITFGDKPVARVLPKSERTSPKAYQTRGDSEQKPLGGKDSNQCLFRPYANDHSIRAEKERAQDIHRLFLQDRLQRQHFVRSVTASFSPMPVSYAPVIDYTNGNVYLQPVPQLVPLTRQVMTSPPAGSVAPSPPGNPLWSPIIKAQPSPLWMKDISKDPPKPALIDSSRNELEQLSAKDKLSSVAWLAASHRKQKAKEFMVENEVFV